VIWGVLQFPGSCDERDALHACQLHGDGARLLWHESRDLDGVDGVVVPGGFSYGDYLRAGAIARFSPAMEAVAEAAAGGMPVLGICNGFQVLCEAGLLPGALLRNVELRFRCHQVELVEEGSGETLSIPAKHGEGRSTSWSGTAKSPTATPTATTPTARSAASPASPTSAATSSA